MVKLYSRGANLTDKDRAALNRKGAKIILNAGISQMYVADDVYDVVKKNGGVGFAEYYLGLIKDENKEPDVEVYKQLVNIDEKLGTTNSLQLYRCLEYTTRTNIVKITLEVSCKL